MSSSAVLQREAKTRKLLGVRATAEEQRVIAEAAAREHRSVSAFVLRAALEAAEATTSKPNRSREEILAIIGAARAEFQAANTSRRDVLAEFLAERRAEAERE